MKRFLLCVSIVLLWSSTLLSRQKRVKQPTAFRVVGYYFLHAAVNDTLQPDSAYRFLNKITHLNIAFINPDSSGNFNQHLSIDTLIAKAHRKKVKVLASIGGGGPHPYYAVLLQDANRILFIQHLLSLVQLYHFDGIDADIEGSDIDSNYEHFITELAASLKQQNKLLTAAIATAYKDQLPDKALQQFDFVTVMSYDRTGPWSPQRPGNHAPYSMAVEDLDYWHNIRSISPEKLVLGLPFYGYGFGDNNAPVVSMDYNEIAALYPGNLLSDTLHMPDNVTMYYNSIATIKRKTALALTNASGVMIWQLLGDTTDDHSLLNAVDAVIHPERKKRPQ